MIDRVGAALGRRVAEVPVGFKWFVAGPGGRLLGFGGEESAGASFLRKDGTVWTTDKDGIILCLLAAEITAATGKDPGVHYRSSPGASARPSTSAPTPPPTPPSAASWPASRPSRSPPPASPASRSWPS